MNWLLIACIFLAVLLVIFVVMLHEAYEQNDVKEKQVKNLRYLVDRLEGEIRMYKFRCHEHELLIKHLKTKSTAAGKIIQGQRAAIASYKQRIRNGGTKGEQV